MRKFKDSVQPDADSYIMQYLEDIRELLYIHVIAPSGLHHDALVRDFDARRTEKRDDARTS